MNEIICRYIEFPSKVNAVTVVDDNGDYNIYINSSLSYLERQKTFKHEIEHIKKSHFYREDKSVIECENEAKSKEK